MCTKLQTYRTATMAPLSPPPFDIDLANWTIRGVVFDGEDRLIAFSTTTPEIDGTGFTSPVVRRTAAGEYIQEDFLHASSPARLFYLPAHDGFERRTIFAGSGGTTTASRVTEYVDGDWENLGGTSVLSPVFSHAIISGSTKTLAVIGRGSNTSAIRYWTGSNWQNIGPGSFNRPHGITWWDGKLYVGGARNNDHHTLGAWNPATEEWEQVLTADNEPFSSTAGRHIFLGTLNGKFVVHLTEEINDLGNVKIFDEPVPPSDTASVIMWDGSSWTNLNLPEEFHASDFINMFTMHVFGKDRIIISSAAPDGTTGLASFTEEDGWETFLSQDVPRVQLINAGTVQEHTDDHVAGSFSTNDEPGWFEHIPILETEFDVELLPESLAGPPEDQIRVFRNDQELNPDQWDFLDGMITYTGEPEFGDRLTAFRETRWDKSWVNFVRTGLIRRNTDLRNFYKQRLFLLQEVCDTIAISHLIGTPIILPPYAPDPSRPGTQVWAEGNEEPIPVEIELLPFSIAGGLKHQIKVFGQLEEGGLLVPVPHKDSSPDADEWTEVEGEIVLGDDSLWGTSAWPLVIRRCTRSDALWHRFQDAATFSSTEVGNVEKQLRFLMEEDWCPLTLLPPGHPLNNHIFPRPLNFLVFQGPGSVFSFGQFQWLPGEFQLFINNIPVEDFDIDFFNWEVNTPPLEFGDIAMFGPKGFAFGGGGFSVGGGGSQGKSEDGDTTEDNPAPAVQGGEQPSWPVPTSPPGIIVPFFWDFSSPNIAPPWGDDSDGQFGAGGYVTGAGFGYKYIEFATPEHPDGRVHISLGRIQNNHLAGGSVPTGVGRWARLWSYGGTINQAILGHSHTNSFTLPLSAPAWVIALSNWYANNLPLGNPLRALGVVAGSNPLGAIEDQIFSNTTAQGAQEFIKHFDPGTDVTQEMFLEFMEGQMAGVGGFPE